LRMKLFLPLSILPRGMGPASTSFIHSGIIYSPDFGIPARAFRCSRNASVFLWHLLQHFILIFPGIYFSSSSQAGVVS
jgi:hypothetical protein